MRSWMAKAPTKSSDPALRALPAIAATGCSRTPSHNVRNCAREGCYGGERGSSRPSSRRRRRQQQAPARPARRPCAGWRRACARATATATARTRTTTSPSSSGRAPRAAPAPARGPAAAGRAWRPSVPRSAGCWRTRPRRPAARPRCASARPWPCRSGINQRGRAGRPLGAPTATTTSAFGGWLCGSSCKGVLVGLGMFRMWRGLCRVIRIVLFVLGFLGKGMLDGRVDTPKPSRSSDDQQDPAQQLFKLSLSLIQAAQ